MSECQRRSLPAGSVTEQRAMRDGWKLRSMAWPAGPRGSLLLVTGRGDFIEKYAESLWHWRGCGFGVAAFDWRGQGGSGRLGDAPDKGHSNGFAPLLADLAEQIAWFRAALPAPHYAVAHSMGGHLLLRHLAAQPGAVDRAVLLAPMLGLLAAPIGPWAARLVARFGIARGRGNDYLPGAGPYAANGQRLARLTGDADRAGDEGWWVEHDPELRLGGATVGWLAAAFASLDALAAPGVLEQVMTPLLILTAANDRLVDSAAASRLARRLPNATLEPVAGAAHELLRERDDVRDPVLARIDRFLA